MKTVGGTALDWLNASIGRKLAAALILTIAVTSLIFLVALVLLYWQGLIEERAQAAEEFNRYLSASLENAMLSRDLERLRDTVQRLGEQNEIVSVMILNPAHEVRFASSPASLGHQFDADRDAICRGCGSDETASTSFVTNEDGREVLRSVIAVRNKQPCTTCHGSIDSNPVNGLLIVDYAARGIKGAAFLSAMTLGGSGAVVVVVAVLVLGLVFKRSVIAPLETLTAATGDLDSGNLDARVTTRGTDELAVLGRSFNDMAERLQTSLRDVRQSERRLQAIIDAIPDGVRVIDDDFTIVQANHAYRKQLGDVEDVVGRRCYASSHRRTEACQPTLVTCPLVALTEDAPPSLKTIQRHVRADGSELFVEVTAARIDLRLNGQRRRCVVESIRDLSEQAHLSHEHRLSELGQLATGVAHEIRNPLSSIQFALRNIERETDPQNESSTYLHIANQEIDRCIEITNRLLRLSTPASDGVALISGDDALQETLSLLRFEAEHNKVRIHCETAPGLRIVAADGEFRMLILNIVQNAFHAMPDGGTLTITGRRVNGRVQMVFEDTGVGINPEDLQKIFHPFWSRRADRVRGTGLGLTICQTIVGRYHGRIYVDSQVGKGTRFIVELPDADVNWDEE
ncbi:MAG: HAMP domain-containing protein [Hyphomicrobiales bacterium]|nr:HAMP domain-containing protein [Hyphomicrobiales bacterium]